jgi:hypothetical protein
VQNLVYSLTNVQNLINVVFSIKLSFIPLLLHQISTELLLCVRSCCRHWEYSSGQNKKSWPPYISSKSCKFRAQTEYITLNLTLHLDQCSPEKQDLCEEIYFKELVCAMMRTDKFKTCRAGQSKTYRTGGRLGTQAGVDAAEFLLQT